MSGDVVGKIILTPDPGLVKSLGANHSLATALADLVDNSVDADASRVLIRFLRRGPTLEEIHVLDNGTGMDSVLIDRAMTLGATREYDAKALGHFGLGLKAAALGTANVLTVHSQLRGATPVGRRLDRQDMARDYSCDVLSAAASVAAEEARRELLGGSSGTTVQLSDLRTRYQGESAVEARTWLATKIHEVSAHLGLVFHRLIADERIKIELEDGWLGGARGAPTPVLQVDPFGYRTTGLAGYPRTLRTTVDRHEVPIVCHVWPPRQTDPAFRLGSRDGRSMQGFYVYRGDRLLSTGGWLDVTHTADDRLLGRVVVEYEDVADHVSMNPEKSSISFDAVLGRAMHSAMDGTLTFADYLAEVEDVQKAAKRRKRLRKPSVALDKGFAPGLRRAIRNELDFDQSFDPMSIRWKRLPQGELIDVDFRDRTVWLNSHYRDLLAGDGRRGMNDAPVLKALVYLLTRDKFMGERLGPKDKDDIALWQEVLAGAVKVEAQRWEESDE
jgi:hypothetical protein